MNGYERGSRKEQDKDRDRCKHYERWRGYESTTRKGGPSTSVRVYKVNGDKDEVLLVIKAKLLCQLQRARVIGKRGSAQEKNEIAKALETKQQKFCFIMC
jgi:hypothetical protein